MHPCPEELKRHATLCKSLLDRYSFLIDSPLVQFYEQNHWDPISLLPDWSTFLLNLPDTTLALLPEPLSFVNRCTGTIPEGFRAFLDACVTATSCFSGTGPQFPVPIVKLGMSPKKQHEVTSLSSLIRESLAQTPVQQIIDFGSGKGYLPEEIALTNPGVSVVGVDREEVNTRGGVERNRLMEKQWRPLHRKLHPDKPAHSELHPDQPAHSELPLNHYHPITMEISCSHVRSDFVSLVAAEDDTGCIDPNRATMLIGLHACGDLTSLLLQTFLKCPSLRSVVSIGCCYHLITQTRQADYFLSPGEHRKMLSDPTSIHAFPMSRFLQENPIFFTRNALNLAQQAPERMAHSGALPAQNLFFRAVFQVLLTEHFPGPVSMNVGHSATKASDFVSYTRAALDKLKLSTSLSDEEIMSYLSRFEGIEQRKLVVFYQLRTLLTRVIEHVILIDRVLYLADNNVTARAIRVFDPVISPRCYAIVASK